MSLGRTLKMGLLGGLAASRVTKTFKQTRWRRNRLLILCFHGVAMDDEHQWNGGLYLPVEVFEQRLRSLREGGYHVLGLDEGLRRMAANDLPGPSVVITFDDGMHDFHQVAFPLLMRYELPATVYLTSYQAERDYPIFRIFCSYVLWKRRGQVLPAPPLAGLSGEIDLRTFESRESVIRALDSYCLSKDLSGDEKNELAQALAAALGLDTAQLAQKRILQVMNPSQVREVSRAGVDIQLHTHRHRVPRNRELFEKEIQENRDLIRDWTGTTATHFCYPSGVSDPCFYPWLEGLGVKSATTCELDLVSPEMNALALPRLLDHVKLTELEYESWLSGVAQLVPHRSRKFTDPEAGRNKPQ